MNSTNYPLERNHYFYGKLLTVRDFETEQTYYNNKTRLLNRLILGSGVVTGLRVIAVDDKSISIESGVALDDFGREIIIPSNVTLKLSMIDGFSNNDYAKNVYLCLAYDERGKEPIYAASGNSGRGGEVSEFNRIMESYRLFIREERPDPNAFVFERLFTQTEIIYQDELMTVTHTTPRYVNPGDWIHAEITIEKTVQAQRIQFTLSPEIENGEIDPATPEITFEEPQTKQKTKYALRYRLRAGSESNQKCNVSIGQNNCTITIGDKQLLINTTVQSSVQIIDEDVQDRLLRDYYDRPLDQSLFGSSTSAIYLAKLDLMQVGSTYMIEKVEQVPFGEYVHSNAMLAKLGGGAKNFSNLQSSTFRTESVVENLSAEEDPYFKATYNPTASTFEYHVGIPTVDVAKTKVRSGVIEFNKHQDDKESSFTFFKSSKSYVSDEITHGLGDGNVLITLAVEEPSQNTKILQGQIQVFKGSEFDSSHDVEALGSILYPEKGTFCIGVKLNSNRGVGAIRIRWYAQQAHELKAD